MISMVSLKASAERDELSGLCVGGAANTSGTDPHKDSQFTQLSL